MQVAGDDAIVVRLVLADETRKAADAAFSRMQSQFGSLSVGGGGETAATVRGKKSLEDSRKLSEELVLWQKLRTDLTRAEGATLGEIAIARRHNLDVEAAQLALSRQLQLTEEMTVMEARARVAARVTELRLQKELLAREIALNKAYSFGNFRDPLGKNLGGVRGKFDVNTFGGLSASFLSWEGMKTRFLSLFAGQIGTLMAYGATIGAVTLLTTSLVGGQSKLMEETARLGVVLDSTGDRYRQDLDALSGSARSWSRAHGQAAHEIVNSMYELGAAGLTALRIMQAFPAVSLLSQGGFIGMANSAEFVTTAMEVFSRQGLEPIRVAGEIQATAAGTLSTVEGLAEAFKYVSGTAQTAGMSFEEVIALLGTLSQYGLRGSIAGTSLNQALTELLKKRGQLREMGVEISDAAGNLLPMTQILENLRSVFGTRISAGEQKLLTDIFNVRGARAMQALIADVRIFPRVLKEVRENETAVFEAAERGSNTLKESWKVFGNQLLDVLLMRGGVAKALRGGMDAITGRVGLRSLQNTQTSVSGVVFELGKLDAAMKAGPAASEKYIRSLSRYWREATGELGEYLRGIQKGRGGAIYDVMQLMLPTRAEEEQFGMHARELRGIYERMIEVGRAQADLARGRTIIESLFGAEPVVGAGAEFALGLARATEDIQRQYIALQARAAKARLERAGATPMSLLPVLAPGMEVEYQRLKGLYDFWTALDQAAGDERDAGIEEEMKKRQRLIEQQSLRTREAEISVMEQTVGLDFEMRRQLVSQRVDLQRDLLDEELRLFAEGRRREYGGTAENYKLIEEEIAGRTEEIELKKTALLLAGEKERRKIQLEELEYYYSTAIRIADLEARLEMERTDVAKRGALDRERQIEAISLKQEELDEKVRRGLISRQQAEDELRVLMLQFDLDEERRAEEERKRQLQLLELGQVATLEEAKRLVARAAGFERFEAERTQAVREAEAERDRIRQQYWNDETMRNAELARVDEELKTKLSGIGISEIQFMEQAWLDSLSAMSAGVSDLSEVMSSAFGDATGKFLADTSRGLAGLRDITMLWRQMQLGEISTLAGGIGIIGTVAGFLAGIFGRRGREEERQVRELVDEFRYREAETVSPEFGRAQVINVRIEQYNDIGFLGSPTRQQVDQVLDAIADPLVDRLEDVYGMETGGR